jgi:hypothetical protein
MKNEITISIPVIVTKRSKFWIAYNPSLKTYGYSDKSKEAAFKDFDAAIKTFFHVQDTLGTLNKTLLGLGWIREDKQINVPKINSHIPPFRTNVGNTTRQIQIPASC